MERVKINIFLRTAGLFLTLCLSAYLIVTERYTYFLVIGPIIFYQLYIIYVKQITLYREVDQFSQALYYRDFSRNFNSNSLSELSPLYSNFNDISRLFQQVSRDKETQYQYLQKILELVNTGILSFETDSGEVIWMNESLKIMLDRPYIKNISSLSKRDESLYKDIISLKPGESKIAAIITKRMSAKTLLSATAFQTKGVKYQLIAFQNINEALDETESKAWQKLLSVLTHEIMNSIAPISSLADTIKNRLASLDKRLDEGNNLVDLELGISTIKKRSEGLLRFAETYRNLNKITKPNIQPLYVRDLFENLHSLMQPTLLQKNIELEIILKDPNLMLDADLALVEQVLINLLVNGIEAVKATSGPRIILYGEIGQNEKTIIKIIDNGVGIDEEVLDKIFIPFFSTRKTGSGIGLTLCKQIMMLHNGSIQVASKPDEGTSFILQF
ncbi:sensor histidine kinase [Daejeonella lutea]|uniref:histidine kinase n=1 Tax=Daejeonella lutea TaxID=572036 RepID=A0A1T5A897_9SPHI|nr:HAMP domain-containing sensor histidine kinase [Daejeonella lutea]SKB31252.1 Histidine kinase-, DNA gyrase B-, and HSP90-like ATPase [Daejeonella lutea]